LELVDLVCEQEGRFLGHPCRRHDLLQRFPEVGLAALEEGVPGPFNQVFDVPTAVRETELRVARLAPQAAQWLYAVLGALAGEVYLERDVGPVHLEAAARACPTVE